MLCIVKLNERRVGMTDLAAYLKGKTYPGRGIVAGVTADYIVTAYFIMGRSENSRNRIFEKTEDGIKTKAFEEAKMEDPSLIIYHPVRKVNDLLIITNGDQTDTIAEFIKGGKTFEQALTTREFEPDAPNFTPRISALIEKDGACTLSILKSDMGDSRQCLRYFYQYKTPIENIGRIIHTYKEDGSPIPSFEGEPAAVEIKGDIDTFTDTLWENLDRDNKVSLFVQYICRKTGQEQFRIVNKNK